jgi:hypothetical protein
MNGKEGIKPGSWFVDNPAFVRGGEEAVSFSFASSKEWQMQAEQYR